MIARCGALLAVLLAAGMALGQESRAPGNVPVFTDVTREAGLAHRHFPRFPDPPFTPESVFELQSKQMSGGGAGGDVDGDGWPDVFLVGGDQEPNRLFHNNGDGTFSEIGARWGVDNRGSYNGAVFLDFDGDGQLDLFTGGIVGTRARLYRNSGDGGFVDVTESAGLGLEGNVYSMSFADYDLDGDVDLAVGYWELDVSGTAFRHLLRNNGDGTFSDASEASGLARAYEGVRNIYSFTPVFADVTNDGWPDLLVAGDFTTTKLFHNQRNGAYLDVTDREVLTDENAMGVALGDYDNDGDIDWFVSSVYQTDVQAEMIGRYQFGSTGNRLYRNTGAGLFGDATTDTGIREGGWGWAACFADFNNDGYLDLFHVNGMGDPESEWWREEFYWFLEDRSRLFMANGDGTFSEQAETAGLAAADQGRALVCFDYDGDGDIDILVANNNQTAKLYRNDLRLDPGSQGNNYLTVELEGRTSNTQAVGARIEIETADGTQMRELRGGNNYLSANPVQAHFGVGDARVVDRVRITWPDQDRSETEFAAVDANQGMVVRQP